ncbi:Protopanaxadiol 6-hydroxylase [Bienertia sinuspersici]
MLVFLHNVVTKFRFKKVNPNEKIIYNPDPIPTEGLQLSAGMTSQVISNIDKINNVNEFDY